MNKLIFVGCESLRAIRFSFILCLCFTFSGMLYAADVTQGFGGNAGAKTGTTKSHQVSTTERSSNIRVVNGEKVEGLQYPWMVALLVSRSKDAPANGNFCGGTLVTKDWVLTAAHCVTEDYYGLASATPTSIWINDNDLNSGEGKIVDIKRIIVHPEWMADVEAHPYVGDLALIKLALPVDDPKVKLVGSSYDKYLFADDTTSRVIGWGTTKENRTVPSPDLLELDMPIINQEICEDHMKDVLPPGETMICSGIVEGGRGACAGDSGGPLLVDVNGSYEQVGIVSYGGIKCAQPGQYGVYMRVSRYADWISETICSKNDNFSEQPAFEFQVEGNQVRVTVTDSSYSSHRIYYALEPDKSNIQYVDMLTNLTHTFELSAGNQYAIAVRGYDGPCTSAFSDIKNFSM